MLKKYNLKNNKEIPKLFSVLVDQAFMSVTTLLTTVVLARTYSRDSYADLVLLFSITLFVLGFQSAIISKPYAINLNDFKGSFAQDYHGFNLYLKLVFTVCIIVIFPILYYFSFDNLDSLVFFLFLLYVVAHSFYFFVRETLLSERKTKQNLIYGLVCSLSIISLLLVILIRESQNLSFFLGVTSSVYIGIALIYFFKNRTNTKILKQQYIDFWLVNWKIGKWLLGSNFLFHLSSNIYPWLLLYITTKDDIAIFGVLMSVANLVNPILTALSSYLLPLFVKMNDDYSRINRGVKKWVLLFGFMAVILVIIGFFFGQYIIDLLFGEKYKNLGVLVIYPFIVQAINVVFQPIKIALNSIKRTDVNFWILIPRSMISVILGYFLISKFAILGVFYTMMIENLFYQLTYFVLYKRIINPKLVHG
ncbi:lipopolysaccharide biosynthesis protein [Aquimarina pacifica]|uniref:lipopolysaccharide biosynthesis protein n=1 Tax=Aquimarina pacifica TaxID=1296415 RepID=UPI000470B821|nr:polysaccharide biosynthesis protein [Aquimarina pacifica]